MADPFLRFFDFFWFEGDLSSALRDFPFFPFWLLLDDNFFCFPFFFEGED